MKKYIEQEAVIRLIKTEGFNEKYDLGDPKDNAWFCEEVNRIPAADVEEVRHGRWIKSESSGLYKCSKCGRYATNSDVLNWEYCNCGAKMDGGGDN